MDTDSLFGYLAVFALLCSIPLLAELIARLVNLLVPPSPQPIIVEEEKQVEREEGCWEVVEDEDNTDEEGCYRVCWSLLDDQGRYLLVGHYCYGPGGNSRNWSQLAATRIVEEFNKEGRRPWEFR